MTCQRNYKTTYILSPADLTEHQKQVVSDWSYYGIPELGTQGKHVWSFSHLDAIESVLQGKSGSRLIIVDGHEIGTGLDEQWLSENFPEVVGRTSFITTPDPIEFGIPVREPWQFIPEGRFNAYRGYANNLHEGFDFIATGDPTIIAAAAGVVERIDTNPEGYGLFVVVRHNFDGDIFKSWYTHLQDVLVEVGQWVDKGQSVGIQGASGLATGPHLHFTLQWIDHGLDGYVEPDIVNPEEWLPIFPDDNLPFAVPCNATYCAVDRDSFTITFIPADEMVLSAANGVVTNLNPLTVESVIDDRLFVIQYLSLAQPTVSFGHDVYRGQPIALARDFELKVSEFINGQLIPLSPRDYLPDLRSCQSQGEYTGVPVTYSPGIHGPGSDYIWQQPDFRNMMSFLDMPVLYLSHGINPDYADLSKKDTAVVRMMWTPNPDNIQTPEQVWAEVKPQVARWYLLGYRRFIPFNEPNLPNEGLGTHWHNPNEFADFLLIFMRAVKADYPDIQLYFTPMSPQFGGQIPWIDAAWPKVKHLCYGFSTHIYTGIVDNSGQAIADVVNQAYAIQQRYSLEHPMIISELSVNRPAGDEYKGTVYWAVDAMLEDIAGIEGVFYYISHWVDDPNGENWYGTEIPTIYKGA